MASDFMKSLTRENLMRAFAGESQARNRYTFAWGAAKKQNMHAIAEVFSFTAGQEKEHAEIFYRYLTEKGAGNVLLTGTYPVDKADTVLSHLRFAEHNEKEEASPLYPSFAEDARKEGFADVAASFDLIAKIEQAHAERFSLFADMLESGTLYEAKEETSYLCLNCGHIHKGKSAPQLCPVCQHTQGYFIPLQLAPYTK